MVLIAVDDKVCSKLGQQPYLQININIKPKKKVNMLVILTDEQILSVKKVCPSCLMADRGGSPRWQKGKLGCGHLIENSGEPKAKVYECQMGFHLADIN